MKNSSGTWINATSIALGPVEADEYYDNELDGTSSTLYSFTLIHRVEEKSLKTEPDLFDKTKAERVVIQKITISN